MAKFNVKDNRRTAKSPAPIQTAPVASGTTGNGAPGFSYDDKSALFLLATNSMFGASKFYETAKAGDDRFVNLVRKVTAADPTWMVNFLTWLRNSGNMRTSAVVGSVEAALVAKQLGAPVFPGDKGVARLLAQAGIGRADEIGEAVAYFFSKYPGKQIPKPLKRGLADAMVKHFNEYTAMKYGSANSGKEFTPDRLINLLHPAADTQWQSDLFKYLVARKYGETPIPGSLSRLLARDNLMALPVAARRRVVENPNSAELLKDAGMTWEALAGWLQGPMDKAAWEAIIPSMGYMALLRNLRNFDEAGVSQMVAGQVATRLGDWAQVEKSKQFPFRFVAAHRATNNLRWASALASALEASVRNIPALPGRTLVLVDTSGSMDVPFSEHGEMKRWDAAALFGIALGKAAEHVQGSTVDVVSYSSPGYSYNSRGMSASDKPFQLTKGADLLSEMGMWQSGGFNIGSGTDTRGAIQRNYRGHDRVVLLTDEQANSHTGHGVFSGIVPDNKHKYSFNLAGYKFGHAPTSRTTHSFGGLTDACFPLMDMIERAHSGRWPWEGEK